MSQGFLACEAGDSIKPGTQAPGTNVKENKRARGAGDRVLMLFGFRPLRGLDCLL